MNPNPKLNPIWRSNFEQEKTILFEKQPDAPVVNGKVTIRVAIGDYFTISTVRTAAKGSHGPPPASEPAFPVPYAADFEGVGEGQEAPLFMQQIGAFEVHPEVGNATNHVVRQMVPELPIGWSDHGSNGPMTLIGLCTRPSPQSYNPSPSTNSNFNSNNLKLELVWRV